MIEIENLNKVYKSNKLTSINNTSLKLPDKGLITLLGPSGSGKTTLLNVIGGLDSFDSGKISYGDFKIDKYSIKKIDEFRNKNISYIFQNYYLINELTVTENLILALELSNIYDKDEQRRRIEEALKAVNMYKYRKKLVGALSGGQQQRISIARALTKKNKLIIADEPTGNLDSKNTIEVMNILRKISETSLVLLVTHNKNIAEFYSDKIINIKDGTIIGSYEPTSVNLDTKDSNIYLKDLKKDEFNNNYNINVYNNDGKEFKLDIVLINDIYYIRCDKSVRLITDTSLNLIDKSKSEIKKEEITQTNYDNSFFKDETYVPKKIKIKILFKEGLDKYNKVKGTTHFLRFGLILIGFAFAYLLSSLFNSFEINNSSIMYTRNSYVLDSTNAYYNTYDNPIYFSKNESNSESYEVDMLDLYRDGKISKFYLQEDVYGYIYDSTLIKFSTDFYLYDIAFLDNTNVIYGNLDKSDGVVITSALANKLISDSKSKIELSQLINKNLYLERNTKKSHIAVYQNYQFDSSYNIKAIVKDDTLCAYIPKFYTNNIVSTKVGLNGNVKSNALYANDLNHTLKCFKSLEALEDVKNNNEYSFELIKGEMPTSTNEVLINSNYYNAKTNDEYYKDYNVLKNYLDIFGYNIVGTFKDNANIGICFYSGFDEFLDLLPGTTNYAEFMLLDKSINYSNILNYYDINKQIVTHNNFVSNQNKIYIVIGLIVVLIIYIYFTHRSRLFDDVKKIGILRAIGKTRKDITLSYLVQGFLESIFTLTLGFIFSSVLYAAFFNLNVKENGIISRSFYQNPLYYLIFILILIINIFFSALPSILLMRNTPSEIIAKYDI